MKKIHDDILKDDLSTASKTCGIPSMMKRNKIAFDDSFEMLNSACKIIMDIIIQKKVTSSANIFVTKLHNGLNKIDKSIELSKDKPVPTSNSLVDAVHMSKKLKTRMHTTKKKRTPLGRLKITPENIINLCPLKKIPMTLSLNTRRMMK